MWLPEAMASAATETGVAVGCGLKVLKARMRGAQIAQRIQNCTNSELAVLSFLFSVRRAFCPGVEQLADLLTKPLPSARIEELVRLWGMRDFAGDTADLEVRPSSSAAVEPVALSALLCLLQIHPARSSSRESEYPGLQLDGSLELYFILGMALVCVLVVWEWLKRLWDRLDAWWAGSHASSRRARRLRRMQRAVEVEDELAAQLHGMSLEDMSSRPPGGESAAHSERAPMPSQSSHELPAPRTAQGLTVWSPPCCA